jgi:hypothetical protein
MRARHIVSIALTASLWTLGASAQSAIDRSFTTTSNNCDDVQWSEEMRQRYPDIDSACRSVEERNGKKYVRFEGTVRSASASKLDVDFRGGGRVQMEPPEGTQIYMNGKQIPVSDLRRGDQLTFYVPEDRMSVQFYPDEQLANTQESQAVNVPIAAAQQTTPRDDEDRMAMLPSTASPLPWLGLASLFMLALGGTLRLFRRQRA